MARVSSLQNERDLYVASFILQQSRDNHTGEFFEGRKLCELQINNKIGRQAGLLYYPGNLIPSFRGKME